MFRQISSLKLFALFDKGRGTARNATGFYVLLAADSKGDNTAGSSPYVNIQLF